MLPEQWGHINAVFEANAKVCDEELVQARAKTEKVLMELRRESIPFNKLILEMVHPCVKTVLQRFKVDKSKPAFSEKEDATNVALLYVLLKWSNYVDMDMIFMLVEGVHPVGQQPISGLWSINHKADPSKALTIEELISNFRDINVESMRRTFRSGHDQEAVEALWKATQKDIERGICAGPFHSKDAVLKWFKENMPEDPNESAHDFCLLTPRFANRALRPKIDENTKEIVYCEKIRPIDDSKFSSLNQTHVLMEKMKLPSSRTICLQANLAAEKSEKLAAYAVDEACAFRSVPIRSDSCRYVVTCQLHPKTQKPVFTILFGMIFGMSPSVASYGRKSEAGSFLNRTLGNPADKFVDDSWVIEGQNTIQSSYSLFNTIGLCLGFLYESQKDQRPWWRDRPPWGSI